MGKSAKFYKRLTKKERKIQALTSEALSASKNFSSSIDDDNSTPLKAQLPNISTTTSSSSSIVKPTPKIPISIKNSSAKITKFTAHKNSSLSLAIKNHRDEILKSILKSSAVSTEKMDTEEGIKKVKTKTKNSGKKGKSKKGGKKGDDERPDYVDIFTGKKTFKKQI
ncbi:hypothetical protein G9A89_015253 [Geosiphon pyriformis]|nr:hypothetical protein G9A89_015253 [Geosiphon pyriformis]